MNFEQYSERARGADGELADISVNDDAEDGPIEPLQPEDAPAA